MAQLEFQVSTKTARLIGRENISDVDGALVELIKNAYDADASCVYVRFDMPFPAVPHRVAAAKLREFFSDEEIAEISRFYNVDGGSFCLNNQLTDGERDGLQKFFFRKNKIIVIDNGCGMTEDVIKNTWMRIGTSDKELRPISPNGRIKTGAKGIGRFALDKLSTKSQVYTKNASDKLIGWSIDWEQFENTKLLNQIYAEIISYDNALESTVVGLAANDAELLGSYTFETGTAVILAPTREMWSDRLFRKVNNNLQSIIPLDSKDKFDVIISNKYSPEYSLGANDRRDGKIDYDYKFEGFFDGAAALEMEIFRNEIKIDQEIVTLIIDNKEHEFNLDDFWGRAAFSQDGYRRGDYARPIKQHLDLDKILADDELETLSKLGGFSFTIYFLKAGQSDIEIVKGVKISKRKEFFKNFSGVKLYRDDFKVRPYGDEGAALFDWIGLSVRAQKSPAAVTHKSGNWRAEPYQVVGSVNIGRKTNPALTDLANREGITPNAEYDLLTKILGIAFGKFEYDRQYVLREYASWRKEKEKSVSKTGVVIQDVIDKQRGGAGNRKGGRVKKIAMIDNEYEDVRKHTDEEYEEAIISLVGDRESEQKTMQIMMAFSSAGVMANTFSHEISRISADTGNRMQHLREAVKRLTNNGKYTGDEDFNPFTLIDETQDTDNLLSSWISVMMKAVGSGNFEKETLRLNEIIEKIVSSWLPLMAKKYITFEKQFQGDDITVNIAEVDVHLILNNFFLNSAWFLEDSESGLRIITIKTEKLNNGSALLLENSGPPLDKNYASNPGIIFNAGETSKGEGKGTGLGLWIVREVVNRNSGVVEVLSKKDGFGIKITFPE